MNTKVFLFTGEEKYIIFQELGKRKKAFEQKHGAQNIFEYKSDTFQSEEILRTIFDAGLFAINKLVIIRWVPTDTDKDNKILASKIKVFEEQFEKYAPQLHPDVVVVFISFKPDKRTTFYKYFSKNATIKDFPVLKESNLKEWITRQAWPVTFDNTSLDHIIYKVGTNLFSLENEIYKILLYCQKKSTTKITPEIIDLVCISKIEINNFDVIDNLLTNKNQALILIEKIQKDGTDWNECIGMLYRWFKVLIQIIDTYQAWITSGWEIAKVAGIHPFAVSKHLKHITTLLGKEKEIKNSFSQLINIDLSIKTGKIAKEFFRLEIKKIITTL